MKVILLLIGLMGLMPNGYAGRPIETDDASVTALRTCQLDFWTETSLEVRQDNFNGGCNFLGNGEFSLGLGAVHGNQEDQTLSSLGYKHIFKHFTDSTAGYGLAASREWGRLKSTNESSQETLLTTIASVPLSSEDSLLHLNLGYLQYRDQTQHDNSIFKAAAIIDSNQYFQVSKTRRSVRATPSFPIFCRSMPAMAVTTALFKMPGHSPWVSELRLDFDRLKYS